MSYDSQLQGALDAYNALTPDQQSIFSLLSGTPSSASSPQSAHSISMASPAPYQTPQPVTQAMLVGGGPMPTSRSVLRQGQSGNRKKRPLNAFMAFRSFYAQIFPGLTQKVKSGLLRSLWGAETRKTLFVLLAQAYTDLRDNHTEIVQLDKFLATAAGQLPIIAPQEYLHKMGWYLFKGIDGESYLVRTPTFNADAAEAEFPSNTSVSSADLVKHCYDLGMLSQSTRLNQIPRARANVMAVPIAPAPAAPAAVQPQVSAFDDFDIDAEMSRLPDYNPGPELDFNFDFNDPILDPRPEYPPSIETVTADQQKAYEQVPLELHFHPEIQPPVLGFDPNIIQDEFDPFSFLDLSK